MCGSDMKSSPGEVGWGEARSALASIIADKALKPNNPGGLAAALPGCPVGCLVDCLAGCLGCLDRSAVLVRSMQGIPGGDLPRPGRGTPIANTHNRIELLNICENCSSGFFLQKGLQA
jgi:hypothetical protein